MLTRIEKLNIAALCVVAVLCVGVLVYGAFTQENPSQTDTDEDYPECIETPRKIFDAAKTAPKLSDIEARYAVSDSVLLEDVFFAMYSDYVDKLYGQEISCSFSRYIDRYYYAYQTDSTHPWLLWYESRKEK